MRNSTCAIQFLQHQNNIICISSKSHEGKIIYCLCSIKFLIFKPLEFEGIKNRSIKITVFMNYFTVEFKSGST